MQGKVLSVSLSPVHGFHKDVQTRIRLLEGLGVEGDAHAGVKAQHLYRQRLDPEAPNLAQVHFLHRELFDEMAERGFALTPGLMGENVLTEGIDLITLPTGTIFRIGAEAVVEISGCRNPCHQIDSGIQKGLTNALIGRDADGEKLRKAGIMGVVLVGGVVAPGDTIVVELPEKPWTKLVAV